MKTQLSVNVNKLATLRNSRGGNNPDVVKTTLDIISYGAQGITVHPRPDGRHIRKDDVYQIAAVIHNIELNIEGYPDKNFLALIKDIKPAQCTLVPDPPDVLTSNQGWSISKYYTFLKNTIAELHSYSPNLRTALFIDPLNFTEKDHELLPETHTDRVELYTEHYAKNPNLITLYKKTADSIHDLQIGLNAGHDLDLSNLKLFIQTIPIIKEVSIGHALICDSLKYGLKETVQKYLDCL